MRTEILAEAVESLQAVIVGEVPDAGADRELLENVVGQLTEYGLVAIHAFLIGQPEGSRPTRNRDVVRRDRTELVAVVDYIVLQDLVDLALHEQSAHESQREVAGRRETQFVAELGVVISADDGLRRIDEVAG